MPKNNAIDKVVENMNATPNIDCNVVVKISRSAKQFDENKHKFKCICCGAGFNAQKENFQKSSDVLFQSNGGYLPWCRKCIDKYTEQLIALYTGNEELAIENTCQRAGWNYDINPLYASKQSNQSHQDRSRISHYAARKNLNCDGRKTYIDSIKNEFAQKQGEIIHSKEQAKSNDTGVSAAALGRWGVGLTPWDYEMLEDHYKLLKKNNPNADNNQEIFIKSLCNLNWLQAKLLRSENCDPSKYTSLVEQYSKTFKQAGLKTIVEKDSSNDEVVGVTLATISQFTPEEFYKDKSLYADWDNLGDYYERHIRRPMENLITGSDIRDTEFFVPENGDDDEN